LLDRQLTDVERTQDPQGAERVTAADPAELPKSQALVADWLSRKYRVAKEPISALVAEAHAVGQLTRVDPMLILSVMAMESRFNPFAASPVGAQGLMQVMTRVHSDKFEGFGGDMAAFDPVSNLRVGALVLKETIRRAGSVEGGLRLYVGAVNSDGADYINKVLGPDVIAEFVKVLRNPKTGRFEGGSAQWVRKNGKAFIRIVTRASNKMSKAHHEAMHEFFQRLMENDPEAAKILSQAANSAAIKKQIEKFFECRGKLCQ
jgi:hypothetical protein